MFQWYPLMPSFRWQFNDGVRAKAWKSPARQESPRPVQYIGAVGLWFPVMTLRWIEMGNWRKNLKKNTQFPEKWVLPSHQKDPNMRFCVCFAHVHVILTDGIDPFFQTTQLFKSLMARSWRSENHRLWLCSTRDFGRKKQLAICTGRAPSTVFLRVEYPPESIVWPWT